MRFSGQRAISPIASVGLSVLGFGLVEWLSLSISGGISIVTTMRPLAGIAAGFCFITPRRMWWRTISGALGGALLARLIVFGSSPVVFLIPLLMTLSIAMTAGGVRGLIRGRITFRSWRETSWFLGVSAALAMPLGGFYGVILHHFLGSAVFKSWLTWSVSTILSYVIFAPLVVIFGRYSFSKFKTQWRSLLAALAIMTVALGVAFAQSRVPLLFCIPPAVMVAALMAEMEGAALALTFAACGAILAVATGHGPAFLFAASRPGAILLIQMFIALLVLTTMPIAAALTEREGLRARLVRASLDARESELKLRLIVDAVDDHAIFMLDPDGRVATWNRGAESIKGYRGDEIAGKHISCFYPGGAAGQARATSLLEEALREGRAHDQGLRLRKDGSSFWAGVSLHAIRDEEGRLVGFTKVTRDLTRQKRHEDDLAAAMEGAEAAAKAKADFLSNMSHEIRTPLTSVIGFADLLWESEPLTDLTRRSVSRIRDGARALLSLVNVVLDYSRIDSGQIALRPSPVRPVALARDVLRLLSLQAQSKNLALRLDCPQDEPEIALALDGQRMRQVLINFLGNAIKFTEKGEVVLSVRTSPGDDGRIALRYEVRDTGPGIRPDQMALLFQRFTQLESGGASGQGGYGLGLAISKGIARAMGGDVGARSRPGSGSTFWIEVPAIRAQNGETQTSRDSSASGAQDMATRRILVVDDQEAICALVEEALADFDIVVARSGEEAIELMSARAFDLVLMDIRMPGIGGVEAAKRIRAKMGNAAPPMIAFTAELDRHDKGPLSASGFDGLLNKPLQIEALRQCAQKWCGREAA